MTTREEGHTAYTWVPGGRPPPPSWSGGFAFPDGKAGEAWNKGKKVEAIPMGLQSVCVKSSKGRVAGQMRR